MSSRKAEESLSKPELDRYERQLTLPQIGPDGQLRLRGARVLIAGAGGLGCSAATWLATCGVGTVGIVDSDRVELSNLQRQILFRDPDIGDLKAEAAARMVRSLNPYVNTVVHATAITSGNVHELVSQYDVVVDGMDNFEARYLLSDACVQLGVPQVYGSVERFSGQVSVFAVPGGPCYRCFLPKGNEGNGSLSCAAAGVLGPIPGLIGTFQAIEAVKLILGLGDALVGRVLLADTLTMDYHTIELSRDEACPVCGGANVQASPEHNMDHGGSTLDEDITAAELVELLRNGIQLQIVDVRETAEWSAGHLDGCVLVPLGELRDRMESLEAGKRTVVYCHSGARSATARSWLQDAGFTQVHNLIGGIVAWEKMKSMVADG